MYSLRRIKPNEGLETNTILGNEFRVIRPRSGYESEAPDDFSKLLKEQDGLSPEEKEVVTCFVCDVNGVFVPILSTYSNYIVTEKGNTYAKL